MSPGRSFRTGEGCFERYKRTFRNSRRLLVAGRGDHRGFGRVFLPNRPKPQIQSVLDGEVQTAPVRPLNLHNRQIQDFTSSSKCGLHRGAVVSRLR